MHTRPNIVFKSVPRADNVRMRFIEGKAVALAALVDYLRDTRNHLALTDRTALVRAHIFPGVETAIDAKNADGPIANIDNQASAFGNAIASADIGSFRCGGRNPPPRTAK
jgi:hypothetical protein